MVIEKEILEIVQRLDRGNVPRTRLAFEVNGKEWDELAKSMAGMQRFGSEWDLDPSPITDMFFMGLHIRKRLGIR